MAAANIIIFIYFFLKRSAFRRNLRKMLILINFLLKLCNLNACLLVDIW